MKKLSFPLIALSVLLFAGCNQQKAEIESTKDDAVDKLDQQMEAVDQAAEYSKDQAEKNATVKKAVIEAERETVKAQLEADKVKARAEADAAKARVDAAQ